MEKIKFNQLNKKKILAISVGILFSYFTFGYLSKNFTICFNQSESFPEKIFIVKTKFDANAIKIGDLITFRNRFGDRYVANNQLFVKKIVCEEGDKIRKEGNNFLCNNNIVAIALDRDSKNRKIESFDLKGIKKVQRNKFFVTAQHPKSYDSRYYGFIDKDEIKGIVLWKI